MGKPKKYREFTVTPGICGFKVSIGCAEAYFGDARSLCNAIVEYLNDPTNAEEEYSKNDLRYRLPGCDRLTGNAPIAPPTREPTCERAAEDQSRNL